MFTDLSIIIVNWNTRDLLAGCLESVARDQESGVRGQASGVGSQVSGVRRQGSENLTTDPCLLTPDIDPCPTALRTFGVTTEVFVVDNASTDGSAEMVREQFPWVTLIENTENVGFARANNQALHQATGHYLLLLNSDTEVRSGALATLVAELEAHPEAGAAGPRVLNPDGSPQNSYGRLPTVLDELLGPYWADFATKPWGALGRQLWRKRSAAGEPFPVDRVSFACTLIRRAALEQVGLLDESFEFYSEDYDWFKRLKDAGWQALYCPRAEIVHHWGASSRQRSEWALRQLYRSKRRYFAKHHGARTEQILRLGLACRFAAKIGLVLASYPLRRAEALRQARLYGRLFHDMRSAL